MVKGLRYGQKSSAAEGPNLPWKPPKWIFQHLSFGRLSRVFGLRVEVVQNLRFRDWWLGRWQLRIYGPGLTVSSLQLSEKGSGSRVSHFGSRPLVSRGRGNGKDANPACGKLGLKI